MEHIDLMRDLSAQGLGIDDGMVRDGDGYYGLLKAGEFHAGDGRIFHENEISDVTYNGNSGRLIIFHPDNRYDVICRTTPTNSEIIAARNLAVDRMEYQGDGVRRLSVDQGPRKAPATIYELMESFGEIFPEAADSLYYDVLKENIMLNTRMLGSGVDEVEVLDDVLNSMYYLQLESRMAEMGFIGKPPTYPVRDHVLRINAQKNKRNPFLEWAQSHEWDGIPRVRTWFIDTMGAYAPVFETREQELKYIGDVTEAWFVGAIRRQFHRTKHEVVPILISTQGIGKGQALKYTAGQDEWYVETTESVSKTREFLESTRGAIIVELSESLQIADGNNEALKSFISKASDRLRRPYMHFEEDLQRRFVLIATSNKTHIFTDETGNRRYFPMFCDGSADQSKMRMFSEDRVIGQYDVEQVWAEALHLFRHNSKWWITKSTMELAELMQQFCTVEKQDIDVIDRYLDTPEYGYTKVGTRISKDIILREVFNMDPTQRIPPDMEEAYNKWASKTGGAWKRTGSCRVRGRVVRGFERIAPPGNSPEVHRLNIVDTDEICNSQGELLIEKFRLCAMDEGFMEPDSEVVSERLTGEDLDLLRRMGLIRVDENGTIRVVSVP